MCPFAGALSLSVKRMNRTQQTSRYSIIIGMAKRRGGLQWDWWTKSSAVIVAGVVLFAGYAAVSSVTRDDPATYVSAYTPAPAVEQQRVRAAFLGDSYTEPAGSYAMMTSRDMCWSYTGFGQGGTGYDNRGQAEEGDSKFLERVPEVVAANPAVVVVQGSTNDISSPNVTNAAESVIDALRAGLPDVKIVLMGPTAPPKFPEADALAVRDQVSAAAANRSVTFIDPIASNFITDPADYLMDGIHPRESGHRAIRAALTAELRAIPGLDGCTAPAS